MTTGPVYPKGVVHSPGGRVNPTVKPKAPKTKTHPVTGLPVMPSAAEIRAEANAQAWKSVQAQQAALPSDQEIYHQYGVQAAAIKPLVDAHRSWLENAGQYQLSQANALSSMVSGAAGAADAAQTGAAGLAGAPAGTAAPSTNVSPTAAAMPVAAYGTSFANYLHSLAPYADAVGGQAFARVMGQQGQDLQSLRDARTKIAGGLPDLQNQNFATLSTNALNEYKGELAALVAGGKNTLAAGKLAQTTANDNAKLRIAGRNADTAALRAQTAVDALDWKKISATTSDANAPAAKAKLATALKDAFKIYADAGGSKQPGSFTTRLVLKTAPLPGRPGSGTTTYQPFQGPNKEQVRREVAAWMKSHNKPSTDPLHPAVNWTQEGAIAPMKNSTVTKGKLGEYTRRMKAWRYLVQQNAASPAPLSEDDLRALFRKGVGAPVGTK